MKSITSGSINFNFDSLDQNGKIIVEYVWIGGTGYDLRSKCKTYDKEINSVEDLDSWNYDGSSCYQATTDNSEILLKPVALFDDPFRKRPNKIALCDTYTVEGKPTASNFRAMAEKVFGQDKGKMDPWFGIEQEYVIMRNIGMTEKRPLGFPDGGFPAPQGQYYCSTGSQNAFGREIVDAHYKSCLYAGVKICGTNAEVMPGQWEYQIGICKGIEMGDHLWMARYIMDRVAELFGVSISIEPKPMKGDWNGSGCHTNYSTQATRNDKDLKSTFEHIDRLKETHKRFMPLYGEKNNERLTGKHETSSVVEFSAGVANRGSSVRIPRISSDAGKGYFEDRRPASNIDPYIVSSAIFTTTCLDNFMLDELENHYKSFLEAKKKFGVQDVA